MNNNTKNIMSFFHSLPIAFQFSGTCSSEVTKCLAVGRRKILIVSNQRLMKSVQPKIQVLIFLEVIQYIFSICESVKGLSGIHFFFFKGLCAINPFSFRLIPIPNQLVCVCHYCRAVSCVVHRDPTLRLDLDLVTRSCPCCHSM